MATKFIVFVVFAAVVGASLASSETASSTSDDGTSYRQAAIEEWFLAASAADDAMKGESSSSRADSMEEFRTHLTAGDHWFLKKYVSDDEQRAIELAICDAYNKNMTNTLLQAIEAGFACENYDTTRNVIDHYRNEIPYETVMGDYLTLSGKNYPLSLGVSAMKTLYGTLFNSIQNLAARVCGVVRRADTCYATYGEFKNFATFVF